MSNRRRVDLHLFRLLALAAGIAIFYYSIDYFGGFAVVMGHLAKLPVMAYIGVVLVSLAWTLSYTEAWKLLLGETKHAISFLALFKVKTCGEAVSLMTPAGFVVGDPIRILLLKKYVGTQTRLRSVVVDRILHSLAAQVFCFLGLLLVFTQKIDFPLWINLLLLAIYLLAVLIMGGLIWRMTSGGGLGLFDKIFSWIKVQKRFPSMHQKLEELREELGYYTDKPKGTFWLAFFYHFIGRALGAVEIVVILYFLSGECQWTFSIILTALTSFVSVVGGAITPGAAGFLETLYGTFAKLYGFHPAMGITIQIVRRLRVFFWIAVGILILDYGEILHFVRTRRLNKEKEQKDRSEG